MFKSRARLFVCVDKTNKASNVNSKLDFIFGDPPVHAGVSRGDWTGSLAVLQMTKVPEKQSSVPASYLYIFVDEKLDEIVNHSKLSKINKFKTIFYKTRITQQIKQ